MKLTIKKNDDGKFEIFNEAGELVETFDSNEEAEAYCNDSRRKKKSFQLGNMTVTYDTSDTVTIDDVELFAVGTWRGAKSPAKGDTYSRADLEAMVDAYKAGAFDPTLKLTHGSDDDQPLIGRVANLRMKGEKLFGDFVGVPKALRDFMKQTGAFARRSAEIFWDYKDKAGKVWKRVLKAVALLAPGQMPAVGALREGYKFEALYSYEYKESTTEGGEDMELKDLLKKYECETIEELISLIERGKVAIEDVKTFESEKKALREESWKAFKDAHKSRVIPAVAPYVDALFDVLSAVEEVKAYSVDGKDYNDNGVEILKRFIGALPELIDLEEKAQKGDDKYQVDDSKKAADEVERLAQEYLKDKKADDLGAAYKLVRQNHPEAWAAYMKK